MLSIPSMAKRSISAKLVKPASKVLLMSIPAGFVLFYVYASLHAAFLASDLPEHVLEEIATSEILGHEMTLDPKSIAAFFLNVWVLPSVVFAGFDLNTRALGRRTRR